MPIEVTQTSANSLGTLLIYIPCHEDYPSALEQLERINSARHLVNSANTFHFDLTTIVSINCNSVPDFALLELSQKANELIDFGREINGDLNINLGFFHGLRTRADFLWILSANDLISIDALRQIMNEFASQESPDVVVGSRGKTLGILELETILGSNLPDLAFGLISSVVYRTSCIAPVAHLGLQLGWTGWGQLAVLEASCIQNTSLKVSAIREDLMHERSPYPDQEIWSYRENNWRKYSHSFPGLPVLMSLVYAHDQKRARSFIESWIRHNWFRRNLFLNLKTDDIRASTTNRAVQSFQRTWSRLLLPNAIGLSRVHYRLLFLLGRLVPDLRALLKFKIFRSIIK